jgi:formylglycine-generating enzyme
MALRSWRLRALLASVALSSACTADFTGYHLESSDGAGGTSVAGSNAAGSTAGERDTGGTSFGSATALSGGAGAENAGETSSAGAPDQSAAGAAGSAVVGPTPVVQPSCVGLADTCGPDNATSCCDASAIPSGTYDRSNRTADPATLSDFMLDSYEISVGRFRNFVAAYSQTMLAAGAGKNPNDAADPGWSVAWNANLPASSAALSTALQCPSGTFTAAVGSNESLPVTCVNWYEAFAFCVWDGGRLPTEAEWNYAAAAGAEERVYPWGSATPTDAYAVFCPGSCGKMQAVGSRAAGNGKWGQADLVGNAWEWNLDAFVNPYPQTSCTDCADTTYTTGLQRVFRGASSGNDASYLLSATRNSRDPGDHNGFIGARCARNPSSG